MSNEEDRLSNLPDHLLHQIFSSFTTKDLIRKTCFLSNRWRNFWVAMPYLRFEVDGSFSRYENFVDQVLLRRGDSTLQRLRLLGRLPGDPNRLNDWITAAVNQQVQEMDIYLEICDYLSFDVPMQLFTSSIRALKLESTSQWSGLQFPDSMLSQSLLTRLELVNVELPTGNSKGELVLSCPVLETLILKKCGHDRLKVLNLSANQLKKLEIYNLSVRLWWTDYLVDCRLELHTPKLLDFVYRGSSYGDYSFGDLAELTSVNIYFCATISSSSDPTVLGFEKQLLRETSYVTKLLRELNATRNLALKRVEIFPKVPDRLGELISFYGNLKKLELKTIIESISDVTWLASFLHNCPSIETLILRVYQRLKEKDKVEPMPPLRCPLKHLKYVSVRKVEGLNCELEFLRFLFNNTVKLESMVITGFTSSNYSGERKGLMKFSEELMLLSKQFPSVEIFQIPDQLGKLVASYSNLKKLELYTFIASISDFTWLASFLRNCPSIETLILRVEQGLKAKDKVEPMPSLMCPLKHLKYVVIREVKVVDSELEILRFVFNNTMKLERIVITEYACRDDVKKRKVLMIFRVKLMLLSQQFPSVEVSFRIR